MKPRIFVQVWNELDPSLNLRVDRQTGLPVAEQGDLLHRVSNLGRAGVASALESGQADVTVFALGDEHEEALRHGLAAGASRAIRLQSSNGDSNVISALAEWLRQQKPDLVIADRIAGLLAARLNWAHLAGVNQLEIEEGKLHAIRHLERGNCESVVASLPAVIRLYSESIPVPYITRARILGVMPRAIEQASLVVTSAARKEIERGPLQPSRQRTKLGGLPTTSASGLDRLSALMGMGRGIVPAQRDTAQSEAKSAQQLADEFVRYLAHHGLLDTP